MEIYVTIITGAITSAIAILAPVLTCLINNKFLIKNKKFDIDYVEKFNILKSFYSAYGKFKAYATLENMQNFATSTSLLVLIADKKSKLILFELLKELKNGCDLSKVETLFSQCSDCLNLFTLDLQK